MFLIFFILFGLNLSDLESNFFPLKKGNKWFYEGIVKWEVEKKVMEKNISWTYEEGKNPSERVIIWDGKNYYEIQSGKNYDELTEMYKNNKENFFAFLKPDNIILSFPLEERKIWGRDESFPRDDNMYCWVLEEVGNKKLKIKGLKSK